MALSNLENRVKQDSAYPRTAEDAIRRDKDLDKVTIKASQIELEGYTTVNGGFKIDNTGNMECKNATVTGGNITMKSTDQYPNLILMDGDTLATSDLSNALSAGGISVSSMNSNYPYISLGVARRGIQRAGDLTLYNDDGESIEMWGELGWIQAHSMTLYDINRVNTNIDMDGETGHIDCVSLTQTSLAERKKNFEKLENALDIVKDTDIYKYNLKDEKETDKKHIGFVIGENFNYRKEITSQENDSAELYSMISVLWKAVQEQQEEIEELRKLVNK